MRPKWSKVLNSGCESYGEALFDLLHQEGTPEARRNMLAHLAVCTACEAEFRAYENLTRRIAALGALLYHGVEDIDICDAVMAEAARAEAPLSFVDAALDASLRELGKSYVDAAPTVNLVDEVMATVAMMHAQEAANPGLTADIQMDFQAYMDDALDPEGMARILAAAEDYPAVQREFESLKALKEDLLAIGETIKQQTPKIDLLYAGGEEAGRPNLLLAKVRGVRQRRIKQTAPRAWSWLGLAAAACLLLGFWFMADTWFAVGPVDMAKDQSGELSDAMGNPRQTTISAPGPRDTLPQVDPMPLPLLIDANPYDDIQEVPEESKPGISLADVLAARREAVMGDGDASVRLALWASLAPEQARRIVELSDATVEELLGASRFLAIEEARQLLEAAVAKYPTDAGLRAALAENYSQDPALADATLAQLAEWSRLDPANGLPYYREAQVYFGQGATQSGIDRLAVASTQDRASAYSLNAANEHAAALVASGMDPELAGLLAAATAGSGEYEDLMSLSQDLLAQGQQFEAMGDFETAQQIYEAVRQLGLQVEQGAAFTSEQLAGLESQRQAINALSAMQSLTPEDIQSILQASGQLVDSINRLLPIRELVDQVYAAVDLPSVGELVGYVLTNGDVSIQDFASEVTNLIFEGVF